MNGINACSSYTAQPVKLGTYERNEKELGPLVSTAIAAGEAAEPAASALFSFSAQGLNELSHALHEAGEGAADLVHGVASAIGDGIESIENGAEKVGESVYSIASSGAHQVEAAAHYVEDKVSSLASSVSHAASKVASEMADAAESAGSYVGSAIVAGAQALDKLV